MHEFHYFIFCFSLIFNLDIFPWMRLKFIPKHFRISYISTKPIMLLFGWKKVWLINVKIVLELDLFGFYVEYLCAYIWTFFYIFFVMQMAQIHENSNNLSAFDWHFLLLIIMICWLRIFTGVSFLRNRWNERVLKLTESLDPFVLKNSW